MTRISALAVVLCLSGFCYGTTVIPMSVEQLTHAASRVVEGQVLTSWSVWNKEHTRIYTYSRVRVGRVLKGNPEAEITVQQVGGSAGGYTMKVSGVRILRPGEEALLFVRPSASNVVTWAVVGLMQGHFRVRTVRGVARASNGIRQARSAASQSPSGLGDDQTLKELESRVHGALTQ